MELFNSHGLKKPTPTATALSKLFRYFEFFLAMVLFSWIFTRLPFAFKTSGHFFRHLAGVVASPLFVFLLCNAIIVTLFVKSERFSGESLPADNAETLLYQELLKHHKYTSSKQFPPEIAIEFQDKEMNSQPDSAGDVVVMEIKSESDSSSGSESDDSRVYRRWKSEKVERGVKETTKLQRSETEKFSDGGDKMSDEEFQRVVDDFIAEHLRFRRQESLQPLKMKERQSDPLIMF